jgi:hypothetical protein
MKQIIVGLIVGLVLGSLANAATVTLVPNAAGDVTQFEQINPNANHWANVNIDDNYGSWNARWSVTGSKYDLYKLTSTAVTGTINSITVHARLYSGSAASPNRGYGTIKIKTGGVEYNGTEVLLAAQPYSGSIWPDYSYTWTTNPGGGAWSWSAINGLQVGVTLREESSGSVTAITYEYVVVDYNPGGATVSPDALFFGGD